MKILHISDTFNNHRHIHELPYADILVHSGNFTEDGTEEEAYEFMEWFCDLPFRHKIFISGNHDKCLYESGIEGLDRNVYYLCNSGIEIEGVKFYGVPQFDEDGLTGQHRNYIDIPQDTDVLITHSPAYGILDMDNDMNCGDEILLTELEEVHPKAHLFGHISAQHGILQRDDTIYSNGAMGEEVRGKLFSPNIIRLPDSMAS